MPGGAGAAPPTDAGAGLLGALLDAQVGGLLWWEGVRTVDSG